jgi:hypothetical protein
MWPDGADPDRLDLLTSDGRIVASLDVRPSTGRVSVPTAGWAAGCYVLRVSGPQLVQSERFVIPE